MTQHRTAEPSEPSEAPRSRQMNPRTLVLLDHHSSHNCVPFNPVYPETIRKEPERSRKKGGDTVRSAPAEPEDRHGFQADVSTACDLNKHCCHGSTGWVLA